MQNYYLELRRKLKAYTMYRFYLKFRLQIRCNRCLERAEIMVEQYEVMNEILYEIQMLIYNYTRV